MTLSRAITDPVGYDVWPQPSPTSNKPRARRMDYPPGMAKAENDDAELIRLLLPTWLDYLQHRKRLPVVVASAAERDRIAARLTPGELARVDWLDEWPRMEG